MNLELASLLVAFGGSFLAAIFDLKTTEIPDKIPHAMILAGVLLYAVESLLTLSYHPLLSSFLSGFSLLGVGFLLYRTGQWGGGDAKVLGAMGFLLPNVSFVKTQLYFPLVYLINVFLVGAVYMIVYSLVLTVKNRRIAKDFVKNVKSYSMLIFATLGILSTIFISISFYFSRSLLLAVYASTLPLSFTLLVYLLWFFAKAVEKNFRKRISVNKLRVGDVLAGSKIWDGLSEAEVKKIKRSGRKYVTIKEGVRFAPSFLLALIFTLKFGNGFVYLAKLGL